MPMLNQSTTSYVCSQELGFHHVGDIAAPTPGAALACSLFWCMNIMSSGIDRMPRQLQALIIKVRVRNG